VKSLTIWLVVLIAGGRFSLAAGGPPLATTGTATEITSSGATLDGTVNPRGADTTVTFEYGTTNAYGTTTTGIDVGSGNANVPVSVPITGLVNGTTYHYRVVAQTSTTTVDGADATFLTLGPNIATTPGTPLLSASGAQVDWEVNPNGVLTGVYFIYGTNSSNLNLQTQRQDIGGGKAAIDVIGFLDQLQPGTTIYYEVAAVSNGIFYYGPLESVTTLAFDTSLVALTGGTANGTGGATYFSFGDVDINGSDGVAFAANLSVNSGNPMITTLNDYGIWANQGTSALALIAQTDEIAPDTASATFETLGDPLNNQKNAVAFSAQLNVVKGQATSTTDTGIWSTSSGALREVAREGDPAPGGSTFHTFQTMGLSNDNTIVIADMALTGGVTSKDELGVWEGTLEDNLELKLRTGDVVGGKTIETLAFVSSNTLLQGQTRYFARNTGDLAALANFTNGTTGIVTNLGGTEALAESVASPVPDAGGATINGAAFSSFSSPIINNSDHLAFKATLAAVGGVTASTNSGIWAVNSADTLELVAQTGQAGTEFTTLSDPVYNDNGAVAFYATYKSSSKTLGGLFCNSAGTLTQVAQIGGQAPGCPAGVLFSSFTVMALANSGGATNQGGLVFEATLTGTGVTAAINQGIWMVDNTGTLQLIVRTGDDINVASSGTPVFESITGLSFLPYSSSLGGQTRGLAKNEDLAYTATFDDGSSGIFAVVSP
jgi:hypothetical protein